MGLLCGKASKLDPYDGGAGGPDGGGGVMPEKLNGNNNNHYNNNHLTNNNNTNNQQPQSPLAGILSRTASAMSNRRSPIFGDHDAHHNHHQKELEVNNPIRIALGGNHESGKTTLFEQIRKISNNSPSQSELRMRKAFICDNIVNSMARVLDYGKRQKRVSLGQNEGHVEVLLHYDEDGVRQERMTGEPLSAQEYEALAALWQDPTVQQLYQRRAEYSLNDSARYFFDNLSRIAQPEFEPTHEDVIRAYIPTVGVQDMVFCAKKHTFQVFDFGGCNVDAQKWHNFYDGICAIIFCLAISTYDQNNRTYNDAGTEFRDRVSKESEFVESYRLLAKICKKEKFQGIPIYVLLNECDIFLSKYDHTAFAITFPGFTGKSPEDAMDYIKQLIKEKCVAEAGAGVKARLRFYFTSLVDTKTTGKTLSKVLDEIASKAHHH